MATPQADPQSIVGRVRDAARSALFQASRPMADRSSQDRARVVGALMHAAEQLLQVADQLEGQLKGEAVPVLDEQLAFDVPPGRSRS